MKILEHLKLWDNTLVIFPSDIGGYVEDEKGHHPNGPWRGEKSQLWEGGHREPFIARWLGYIPPRRVCRAAVRQRLSDHPMVDLKFAKSLGFSSTGIGNASIRS